MPGTALLDEIIERMAGDSSTPILPSDDFRARRDYLPDDAFALVTGSDDTPTDPLPEDQWNELINLPTDVLLRTSDHHGTQLGQMNRLWGIWIRILPVKAETAPYMFNAGWDAADDFNAATFVAAHGYYRQGLASLRSALESLTIAAGFAVRNDTTGLEKWLAGETEPKFGNARDLIEPLLGDDPTAVLKSINKELSVYVHAQKNGTNAALWDGSNGPVWEVKSFHRVYCYFRDVMAMGLVLLALGWSDFRIPDGLWSLFKRPGGPWSDGMVTELKQRLA